MNKRITRVQAVRSEEENGNTAMWVLAIVATAFFMYSFLSWWDPKVYHWGTFLHGLFTCL